MADTITNSQEVVEVISQFTVPPEVLISQEVIEIINSPLTNTLFVTQETIEVIYAGPYIHRYGPRIQGIG